MQKNTTKPKKVHWIPPPGKTCIKEKIPAKGKMKNIKVDPKRKVQISETSRNTRIQTMYFSKLNITYDVEGIENNSASAMNLLHTEESTEEIRSVSSCLPDSDSKDDASIYLRNMKQELRVFNLYYMSLRPVSQKLNRLIGNINIQDDTVQELLSKVEVDLNSLFGSLEDLEYSISLFENALSKSSHSENLLKVIRLKENLLKKLLDCYHGILAIFVLILEESSSRDAKEFEKECDIFTKRYQALDRKYLSQAATVIDLERQLSILQSKYKAVEGYNTTLEETKAEFQKMIHDKDVQIRSLSSELTKMSVKQDDEKWIELMEEMKAVAEEEKKKLKNGLKAQKVYIKTKRQQLKELEEEKNNKVKMLLELAAERDKLKVQMTVTNNELVQARYQVEEIKSQKLKLENKLCECEINFRNQCQEESEIFEKQLKEKEESESKLKNAAKQLEEELSAAVKELDVLKSRHDSIKASLLQAQNEHSVDKVFDEVRSLTSLLQDTREHFQNFKAPDGGGDSTFLGKNPVIENVVVMMQEMKRELFEMKSLNRSRNQYDKSNESDLSIQLEELKQKHKSVSEENEALKRQIKEGGNPTFPQYAVEESSTNNLESNFPSRDFQLQLALKNEEIWKYKQREKKLEYQLDEVKDKLQKKEMENVRLFSLEESLKKAEEELKSKKLELSLLEQRKQEESERLLKRIKDLQEALDESTSKNDVLSRHLEMLKDSLYNVFGES